MDARHVEVHLGLRHLALEVRRRAQPFDDEVGADVLGDVDDELGELHDFDVVEVRQRLLDHGLARFQREQRLTLLRVAHRRDDDPVEQERRGFHELSVSVVKGVERTRIEHGRHVGDSCGSETLRRQMVTTVVPYARVLTTAQPAPGSIGRSLSSTAISASRVDSTSAQAS